MSHYAVFTCDQCGVKTEKPEEGGWVRAHINAEQGGGVIQRTLDFCAQCSPSWDAKFPPSE